jgi:hypothetical protein
MYPDVRFKIAASCRFWWSGSSGVMNFATGMTSDLGSGGVCVISEVLPEPGARVMLDVDVPRLVDAFGRSRPDLLFRAEGFVLEHLSGNREFVVSITYASLDGESQGEESKRMEGLVDAAN